MRAASWSATAVHASSRGAVSATTPVWAAVAFVGVRGCPPHCPLLRCLPRQCVKIRVGAIVSRDGAANVAAQNQELRYRRTRCICCRRCQPRRPCRRCSGLCCRSLAFLCHGELGLLPTPRARGDRAPRLPCGHGALLGGCCMERGLLQTSCCSPAQRERSEQGQLELLLLPARAAARLGKKMSRRCSGYRTVWL